ncbi:MAG: cyclic nucleotide-binding domain-containing protein [Planctomycetia bacterium]|nr:cyclic nucleotide-binding domain-containing protein [Planctomycetia bacterium]
MKELEEYLNKLLNFTENEMQVILSFFAEKKLKKNEYFATEGEYSKYFAFIISGVMRAFYRNIEGDEYNKTFFTNSSFVGAYSSLVTGQENLINIQCLTDCLLLKANFKRITKLYDSIPKIERLSRIIAEQFFVRKEKREIELVMLEASDRYEIFKKEHTGLENLIPQYQIASYLGVTPTQLSRIRAKK